MHTLLARDACRGATGCVGNTVSMGTMEFNARTDTTGHFYWCFAVQKHVGLTVLVAATYAVASDPSRPARSWIT